MRKISSFFHILVKALILFSIYATCKQWYHQNNSHLLKLETYHKIVNNGEDKIIKFFTPWCRYCKFMKPTFDKYKDNYQKTISNIGKDKKNTKLKIGFYQINCDDEHSLCDLLGVNSYPQIKIYTKSATLFQKIEGFYPAQTLNKLLDTIISQLIEYEDYEQKKYTHIDDANQAQIIKIEQLASQNYVQKDKLPNLQTPQPININLFNSLAQNIVAHSSQVTQQLTETNALNIQRVIDQQTLLRNDNKPDQLKQQKIRNEVNNEIEWVKIIAYLLIVVVGICYFINIFPDPQRNSQTYCALPENKNKVKQSIFQFRKMFVRAQPSEYQKFVVHQAE